ncbi:amidohydrolase family protein [Ruegeria sp. HKCCD8929]|uniref:amidohydrolase family protein n=1 Tax=Ruegeria sp. HKCCD8929 TaxID=2683006 RepID=UPI001488ED21|nr:amidohydrolase family protein [Ruegeria sp. HKCCD8929]
MRDAVPSVARLPGVRVPTSVLADEDFGGQLQGDCLAGDLIIRDGRVAGLEPASTTPTRLVLPKFSEPHVHLDKCHTIDRMEGVGGGLAEAIEAQARERETWTEADIRARAGRGLQELLNAGCVAIRTHVDWGTPTDPAATPLAWDIIGELVEDLPDATVLQRAALTDVARMTEDDYAALCARQVSQADAVLGAFVLDQPNRREGILSTFRVAERIGTALDFHVDEGLEPGLDGLEMIADVALETGFQGPVLCGHACSLMNFEASDVRRIADKLAQTEISIAALPATNLYLQGRRKGTPDRRGITCIRELQEAGVNVVLGADNVCDAFCPLGSHDPLATLSLAALAAHLDPPFGSHLPMITTGARRALGLAPITVDGAAIGDLQLFDAPSVTAILSNGSSPRPLAEVLQGEQKW